MNALTRFEIKKLHGHKHVDLRFVDNTLILVGENGAGKTTILNLFYYLLSGQWSSMVKYDFDEVGLTIGRKNYKIRRSDLEKSFHNIDRHFLSRLPPLIRDRIHFLMQRKEGRLVTPELETLCREYGVPLEYVLRELDIGYERSGRKTEPLRQTLEGITESLDVQLLFLPTYRRIEHELNLIFKGLEERELRHRRELLTSRRGNQTYVELIEFGMKDVETAINTTLSQLNTSARESSTT
jgi:predicted ATP-dependent endonuclease of OLD family